jgi:hypothetical protein
VGGAAVYCSLAFHSTSWFTAAVSQLSNHLKNAVLVWHITEWESAPSRSGAVPVLDCVGLRFSDDDDKLQSNSR